MRTADHLSRFQHPPFASLHWSSSPFGPTHCFCPSVDLSAFLLSSPPFLLQTWALFLYLSSFFPSLCPCCGVLWTGLRSVLSVVWGGLKGFLSIISLILLSRESFLPIGPSLFNRLFFLVSPRGDLVDVGLFGFLFFLLFSPPLFIAPLQFPTRFSSFPVMVPVHT